MLAPELVTIGATRPVRILPARSVEALADELGTLRLTDAPRRVGEVTQVATSAVVDLKDERRWPHAAGLSRVLSEHLSRRLSEHLPAGWRPNEASVMRYPATVGGISAHYDGRRYRDLIAILTVEGEGELAVVRDRAGRDAIMRHICRSGDLVLLRAPGFGGEEDRRPLHQVGPPLGGHDRVSLTFRYDAETMT